MSENAEPKPDVETPAGFTEVSGPAAFKAKLQEAEAVQEAATQAAAAATVADTANQEKIKALETALAQGNDQLLRTVAEMENLRKRSVKEREDASKFAISNFAKDLLDVADNFRRALDAIPVDLRSDDRIRSIVEGIEATERTLLKAFEKNGIRKLEPMDEPFNANFHEVMFEAPVAGKAAGTIIQLIEVGYVLNDRLLRPARVGVAKGDGGAAPTHQVDTQA